MKNATISVFQAELMVFMIEDNIPLLQKLIKKDICVGVYKSRIKALEELKEQLQSIIDKES